MTSFYLKKCKKHQYLTNSIKGEKNQYTTQYHLGLKNRTAA